jgi:cell division protein FtsQ
MKTANRRKRRDEFVLDVKVQAEARTRHRLRIAGAIAAMLAVSGLTGYGLYRAARLAAARLVLANPRFALAQITVDDDGVLGAERVIEIAGVRVGQNLFSLDLDVPKRNLQMISLVRRVEVRRVLPDRLHICVSERVPVARLQMPGHSGDDAVLWVDREGVVMRPVRLTGGAVLRPFVPQGLPVLTGLRPAGLRVGQPVESESVRRALELLDSLKQSAAGALLEAAEIDLSRPHQIVMTTRQGATVRFDVEEFPRQLRRLSLIVAWAQQRQKTVRTVDLTVNRGVPVSFVN